MSNVFCIGNGKSRKDFNLEKLRPHGKIYGCNALYRTFTPDVLTAVDHGIMHEIYHSGYCNKNETWFRDWNKQIVEQVVWPVHAKRLIKYEQFVKYNETKCKLILKEIFVTK